MRSTTYLRSHPKALLRSIGEGEQTLHKVVQLLALGGLPWRLHLDTSIAFHSLCCRRRRQLRGGDGDDVRTHMARAIVVATVGYKLLLLKTLLRVAAPLLVV